MITISHGHYVIPHGDLERLLQIDAKRYDKQSGKWLIPFVVEMREQLLDLGFKIKHLDQPKQHGYRITIHGDMLRVDTLSTPRDREACRMIPEARRFDGVLGIWLCKPSDKNASYLRGVFPTAYWDDQALAAVTPAKPKKKLIIDFKCKLKQFPHQLEDFHRSRDREYYAFFWDQGTGKTKQFIDTFAWNLQQGKVDALLVVTPNAVKATWQDDELPEHVPEWLPYDLFVWDTPTKHKANQWILSEQQGKAKVMLMNVEALSHPSGVKAAELFLGKWRCMMAIDESSVIGNPKAQRTKAVIKLGKMAKVRRIGDGTPATESPMEFFSQCLFLSPNIFGTNFYSYRAKYAVLGGWMGKQIVGYENLEQLQMIVDEHSSRYLKTEVFDLPPQQFTKRVVELTTEQRRMYDEIKEELLTETKSGTITVEHTITKLLRLHQICGGFMPATMFQLDKETGEMEPIYHKTPPPIPGRNPKFEELLNIGRQTQGKIIVYCRFRPEMDMITRELRKIYGDKSLVEMRGGMKNDDRRDAKKRFQKDPEVKWMVAQSRAAGRGLTLTASHTVVYFSNDFSLRIRLQSQDRVHRYGQKETVTYIDIVCKSAIDEHVMKTLRKKKNLSDIVHGDPSLSWL